MLQNVATLERQALLEFDGAELTERLALLRDQMDRAQAAMSKLQSRWREERQPAVQLSDYLGLRRKLRAAIASEDYRTAASLHARLQDSLGQAAARNAPRPVFGLGELVQHSRHDYCGTVIGWRAGCPEDAQWRDAAGYGSIPSAESEIWYFLLVNAVSGEPKESGLVPVALVPERCLGRAAHSGEFSRSGASAQSAAVLEALFLGYDDEGQLVACQQLKDRFARPIDQIPSAVAREVFVSDGLWQGIDEEDIPDEPPLFLGQLSLGGDRAERELLYGKDYIPGIDMSSLSEDGTD